MALAFSANIEHWQLDRLIPHARNARTHSEDQIAQIASSIAEFGFVNLVLVGDDGVIVAGHGRAGISTGNTFNRCPSSSWRSTDFGTTVTYRPRAAILARRSIEEVTRPAAGSPRPSAPKASTNRS